MAAGNVDTLAAILEFSIDGSSKKILQSKTGIAPARLSKLLVLLESKNLVRILQDEKGKNQSVKITERGTKFLEMYEAIRAKYLSIPNSR